MRDSLGEQKMGNPLFLRHHKPSCDTLYKPCPTCLAWKELEAAGLTERFHELLYWWEDDTQVSLNTLISELKLSVRLTNTLTNDGKETLADIVKLTEAEFLRIPNSGRKSLNELKAFLHKQGLELTQSS